MLAVVLGNDYSQVDRCLLTAWQKVVEQNTRGPYDCACDASWEIAAVPQKKDNSWTKLTAVALFIIEFLTRVFKWLLRLLLTPGSIFFFSNFE